MTEPPPEPPKKRESFWIIRAVLLVFLAIGGGLLWKLTLEALLMFVVSRSWEATPCVVLSSELLGTSDEDSGSYFAIRYRYTFHGESFISDRFAFGTVSTSVGEWKQRAAAENPPGHETMCFVNPAHPASAVIERAPHTDGWIGLVGLPFFAIGCTAFRRRVGSSRANAASDGRAKVVARQRKASAPVESVAVSGPSAPPGWRLLKPTVPRGQHFVVILLAALFWNVITFTMIWQILRSTPFKVGPLLFACVFVLGGVLLIGVAVHRFLARFNPTLRVLVQDRTLRLGGSLGVQWEFESNPRRIRTFSVTLEGMEVATYTRGTNTYTDRRIFVQEELFTNTDPLSMSRGEARLQVPVDSMHTFLGSHNSIVWQVRLHGGIPRFPDVNDEFTLQVEPLARS